MDYRETPLVVKIGGSTGVDLEALCQDIAARWHAGERLVLVHGGAFQRGHGGAGLRRHGGAVAGAVEMWARSEGAGHSSTAHGP